MLWHEQDLTQLGLDVVDILEVQKMNVNHTMEQVGLK